jgi:predicted RNA-binding Zn-ribbon protein involved in translation (DUF1610 family)
MASLRHSAKCSSCGIKLISPKWSESVSAHETIHIWHCPICGNEFETIDDSVAQTPSGVCDGGFRPRTNVF